MIRDLAAELRADLASARAVAALSAGLTSGLGLLVAQVAFGSFIFSGPLASYSSQGVASWRASGYDADGARMSQYRPGGVVWPPGSLHEKDASVIADEPCRTMHLTPDARIRLEQRDPQLALMLYRYLFGVRVSRE